MDYKQLSNFTYDELSAFSYGNIELTVEQLIKQLRDDNPSIPVRTQEKLTVLYTDFLKS